MEESFEEASETENDQTQSAVQATSNTNSNGKKLTNQKEQASKLCKMPIVRYLLFFCQFQHLLLQSYLIPNCPKQIQNC